ncbi:hypothetical protein [Aquimarina longa]|nr:hypothetical protein [Aquimarina longa]
MSILKIDKTGEVINIKARRPIFEIELGVKNTILYPANNRGKKVGVL